MCRKWNAESVRALRRRLGFTQKALAYELGVRQPAVSDWEVGHYQPRGVCEKLLDLLADGQLPPRREIEALR